MTGEAIRLIRVAKGYSGKQLAEKIGYSPQQLSRIERGYVKVSMPFVEKFAAAVCESPSTILFFCEELDGDEVGVLTRLTRPVIMAALRRIAGDEGVPDEQP